MVSTCNGRLDLGTLGFRLIMPTNLPGHCLWRGKVDSNNFRWPTLEVLEEIELKWANWDLSILHPTRYNITLLNVMGPRNTTIRCYEFNLNLSLPAQLFEHLTSIFWEPTKRKVNAEVMLWTYQQSCFKLLPFLCDPSSYCLFGWDRCERFCSYVPSFFHRWIHLLLSSSSFYITILSWLPRFRRLLYWADCRFSGAQNSGDYARDVHTSFGITSLMKMGKYLSRHFPKTGSDLMGDRSPTLWISTTYLQMCVEGDGKSPMPVSSLWDSALNF
jgi:hypothetical protein